MKQVLRLMAKLLKTYKINSRTLQKKFPGDELQSTYLGASKLLEVVLLVGCGGSSGLKLLGSLGF